MGYPYLMRHSIVDEDDIDHLTGAASSHSLEIGCCDHIFMFNDLRLASETHDRQLLQLA